AVLGGGGGVVDAGLNAHVALERGARVMHLLHASFGVGATTGPALMTLFVVGSTSWRWGFAAIGVVQLLLGVLYLRTRKAWGAPEPPVPGRRRVDGAVVLSLAVFAVYTGLEVAAGQWAFSVLSEGRGVSAGAAGLAVTGFWGALTLGRLVAGAAGERWRPGATLSAGLALSVLGTVLFWWAPVMWVGAVGLLVVGLGLAPIFPMLTLLTPMRVGRERSTTVIGYQLTAASIGAVALPGGIGWLVGRLGLEVVAPVLVGAAVVLVVLVGWSGRASVATP
ncbi:MAG: MFS transporter, partial [Acidimicrobiia bacterium]